MHVLKIYWLELYLAIVFVFFSLLENHYNHIINSIVTFLLLISTEQSRKIPPSLVSQLTSEGSARHRYNQPVVAICQCCYRYILYM